jgi:polyisoprenyl-phosphate glycosyltransferase
MSDKKLISVVVPVYSEEENLPVFYEQICKAVNNKTFNIELIFVNDGSKDRSLEVLCELNKKDKRVKILNLSRNSGSYAAIEAGFTYAKGDAVMAISADLQDPPSIINDFYKEWQNGYDIVWGIRDGREDPFFKSLFAKFFYGVVRKTAFPDFPKDGMDIGLFDRRIINLYLGCKDRNSIPFFTIYSMGFRQKRIPYKRLKRLAGESGWPFWKRVKCAIDIAIGFSYVPIRFFTVLGLISALLAFLYTIVILFMKLFSMGAASGWSSTIFLILFFGGLQMCFIGIVAEYIWRIYDRVKNKPVYFVMDEIGEWEDENRKKDNK